MIISPYSFQTLPWPYYRGPKFTRPVMAENTGGPWHGPQPLVSMDGVDWKSKEMMLLAGAVVILGAAWFFSKREGMHDGYAD